MKIVRNNSYPLVSFTPLGSDPRPISDLTLVDLSNSETLPPFSLSVALRTSITSPGRENVKDRFMDFALNLQRFIQENEENTELLERYFRTFSKQKEILDKANEYKRRRLLPTMEELDKLDPIFRFL